MALSATNPSYNSYDHVLYYDTTADLTGDTARAATSKTAKAIAFDDLSKVYISNGTSWISM